MNPQEEDNKEDDHHENNNNSSKINSAKKDSTPLAKEGKDANPAKGEKAMPDKVVGDLIIETDDSSRESGTANGVKDGEGVGTDEVIHLSAPKFSGNVARFLDKKVTFCGTDMNVAWKDVREENGVVETTLEIYMDEDEGTKAAAGANFKYNHDKGPSICDCNRVGYYNNFSPLFI